MPESDWQAWVEILPDFSKFGRKADTEISDTLGSAGSRGGARFMNSFTGRVFKGNFLSDLAFRAIDGVTNAVTAGINYAFDAVDLGSSLGEQVNAVQVQFGDLSDEVLALSERAPKALNLTRKEFDQLAVRFSSFAKTVAGRGGDASKVIGDLTQRGADFASVYDIEVGDALTLFQSGLAGETEPLRRFGIDLSAARVEAYAYKNGIADVGAELTEAQKVQARYGALLEQTAAVQGDLANTGGSYANQQRRNAVLLEEAQTKFGQALLPTANKALQFANERLIPILDRVLDRLGPRLGAALDKAGPKFDEIAAKLEPLVLQFADWASSDGIDGVIDGLNTITDNAPGWIAAGKSIGDAYNWLQDPFDTGVNNNLFELPNVLDRMWSDFFEKDEAGFSKLTRDLLIDVNGPEFVQKLEEAARRHAEAYSAGFRTADGWDRLLDPEKVKHGITAPIEEATDQAVYMAGIGSIEIANEFQKGADLASKSGKKLGIGFTDGLASAILDGRAKVGFAAAQTAQAAALAVKKKLDIRSPSHVMYALGESAVDGLIGGWTSKALDPMEIPQLNIPDPASQVRAVSSVGSESGSAGFPSELTLVVDGRPMRAYIVEGAQQVVGEYDRSDQLTTRVRAGR